jgi:hypothetical protein
VLVPADLPAQYQHKKVSKFGLTSRPAQKTHQTFKSFFFVCFASKVWKILCWSAGIEKKKCL